MDQPNSIMTAVMSMPDQRHSVGISSAGQVQKSGRREGVQPLSVGSGESFGSSEFVVEAVELGQSIRVVGAPEMILETIFFCASNRIPRVGVHFRKQSLGAVCEIKNEGEGLVGAAR